MAVEPSDYSAQGTGLRFADSHPIPLFSTTVTAFVGRTQRGPMNESVTVESFEAFRRVFGGHGPLGFLSQSIQQYFDHGGRRAVVVRVANRAVRATLGLPAGDSVLRLQVRDPGCHNFIRVSVDYDGIRDEEDKFNLVVQRVTRPGSQLVEDQELFRQLSMSEADAAFVVDVLKESRLVRLVGPLPALRPDATSSANPGQPIPYLELSVPGSDGEELTDYDIIGSNEERTGLFALEGIDNIDLLCIPALASGRELGITAFLAAERYCKHRQALLIWDPPWSWTSVETALIGMRNTGLASQNAITYFPRAKASEMGDRYPNGLPICGAIAGLLARNDETGVWHDLSACDTRLKSNFSAALEIGDREAAMLRRQGINCVSDAGDGVPRLHGNVTLAGSSAVARLWQRLDRRRLALFILGVIQRHTRWGLGESRGEELFAALDEQVGTFLNRLFLHGALAGLHPRQAYSVRVGSGREGAELVIRVGIALGRASEFQMYDVIHREDGSESKAVPPMEAAQLAG